MEEKRTKPESYYLVYFRERGKAEWKYPFEFTSEAQAWHCYQAWACDGIHEAKMETRQCGQRDAEQTLEENLGTAAVLPARREVQADALEQTVASALEGVELKRGLAAYVQELRAYAGKHSDDDNYHLGIKACALDVADEIETRFLGGRAATHPKEEPSP